MEQNNYNKLILLPVRIVSAAANMQTSRVTIKELTDSMNAALLVANDINIS